MSKYANIKVLTSSKKDFDEMLERFGKNEKRYGYQLFQQMMGYFQKTGYDPAEEFETPAAEMKKLRNTLVSFIRKQEKDYIIPLNDKVDHLIKVTAAATFQATVPSKFQQMSVEEKVKKEEEMQQGDVGALKARIAELESEKSELLEKQASMLKLYRKIGNSLEKTSTGLTAEWVIFNFSRQDYYTIQNYVREDS